MREPGRKLVDRPPQRPLRIQIEVPREVHEGEEDVPHLVLDRARFAEVDRLVELRQLFGHLGSRPSPVFPVEPHPRHLLADPLRTGEGRHAARHAAQDSALALLPVSYTHLDVYKRQLSARRILAENGIAPLHPVEALAEAYGLSPDVR